MLKTKLPIVRKKNSITQEELAKRVGVRRETIIHLEAGKFDPSLRLAINIAHEFGLPVESLFWYENKESTL